jgi:hypothetical protein
MMKVAAIAMMKGHGWIGENEEIEKSLALAKRLSLVFPVVRQC